jgi:hypothetical protein
MNRCGFRLLDKQYRFKTARETYLNALRVLKIRQPRLYELMGKEFNSDKRGYFVSDPKKVYLSSPELADKDGNVERLENDWYTATNISNSQKVEFLMFACGASGIRPFNDFEVWFEGGNNKYSPPSKEEVEGTMDELDRLLSPKFS